MMMMMIRILKNNRAVLDRLVLLPDEGEPNAAEGFVHNYYTVNIASLCPVKETQLSMTTCTALLEPNNIIVNQPLSGST